MWFESLEVHRALGIGRGEGFSLREISPNVNLVVGPNGSGKTTTARVIQELLWPGRTDLERPSIDGTFHEGSKTWSVTIDAGRVDSSCDGQTGTTPDFGPVEQSQRYHLALHDLLVADNADFARQIKQTSQGGFDLDAAAEACGFTATPTRRRGPAEACALARKALEDAQRKQAALDKDSSNLARHECERDEANRAGGTIVLLEKARELLDTRQQLRELQAHRDALPDILGRMRGDELSRLEGFAQREHELAEKLVEARKSMADGETDIAALGLDAEDLATAALVELRSRQRRLAAIETELLTQEHVLERARAAAEITRRRLGDAFTDDQLSRLDAVEIEGLLPFARETAQVRARRALLDEHRRRLELGKPADADGPDPVRLRAGLAALANWLSAPGFAAAIAATPAHRTKRILTVAAGMAFLSIVLSMAHHPNWALLSLPAIAVLILELLRPEKTGGQAEPDTRKVHRATFEQTGLELPGTWTIDTVTGHVTVITRELEACLVEEARRDQLGGLSQEEECVRELEATLGRRRDSILQDLGLQGGLDGTPDDLWLPLLVENLIAWQQKTTLCAETQAWIDRLTQEQRDIAGFVDGVLRPHGLSSTSDSGVLAQIVQDLDDRQSTRRTLQGKQLATQRWIDDFIEPGHSTIAAERRELLSGLGLREGEEHLVPGWLKELETFQSLARDIDRTAAVCESHAATLEGHDELLAMEREEIEPRIAELRRQAARHDALSDEIAAIKNRVDDAKRGFDLTDRASALALATADLAELKDLGDAAVTGAVLVDWVRTVAIENSRPLVFKRANELFISFTKGALQLDIDDSATPPCFLARRGSEPGRPVDQLSVGERVQLLMAVRIAFLEQTETTCLPLLMDEALGTSDDRRAGAIIDTVMAIAKEGRQVFYFTAQIDEVDKWRARLKAEKIGHRVIDLAVIRDLGAAARAPLSITPIARPKAPSPNGCDHLAYAEILGVPNFDPRTPHLDNLHLWHVIDDVNMLRRLLDQGVKTWSQFSTLREFEGTGLFDMDDRHVHRIDVTRRAIEAACTAWRIGRGKVVDRAVLQDSDCVSEVYIDRLVELSASFGGDAARLIDALANQEVARWHGKNTVALRDFFDAEGYLVPGEPLPLENIRLRTLTAVGADFREGIISEATIDRIVASLPQG